VAALDRELRNVVHAGIPIADAVRASSATAADLLGLRDRGRIAAGLRADLVVLDAATLAVRRVMRGGTWIFEA
jgi:N-acetylglucosamine-6-phosphate deacetylase